MATSVKKGRTPRVFWGIGKLMLRLAQTVFGELRITHSYRVKIAKLEHERDEKLVDIRARRDLLINEILSLAQAHKDHFSETKSIALATGQVGLRNKAASVKIVHPFTEEDVVARLKRTDRRFLRVTTALNREAILEAFHKGEVLPKGIIVPTSEEFYISLAPRGKDRPKPIVRDA